MNQQILKQFPEFGSFNFLLTFDQYSYFTKYKRTFLGDDAQKKVDDDNCLEGFSTLPTKQNPWDKSGSIPTVCGANVLEATRLEF